MRLGLVGLPSATVDGSASIAPNVLPSKVEPLLGDRVTLAVRLEPQSATRLRLDQLHLQAAAFTLNGGGNVDFAAEQVDAALGLQVPDLAVLSQLAGQSLEGTGEVQLAAVGALNQPNLHLSLDLAQPGLGELTAKRIQLEAAFDPQAPIGAELPPARLGFTGQITGLQKGNVALGDDPVTLEVTARLDEARTAHLEKLALQGPHLEATGRGAVNIETLVGNGQVVIDSPDLAAVAQLLQPFAPVPSMAGQTQLTIDLSSNDGAQRIAADLRAQAHGLEGLPVPAPTLVGPEPTLEAHAVVEDHNHAVLKELRLQGAKMMLQAQGSYSLQSGAIEAGAQLSLPALAALEPVIGQPIAGTAQVKASVTGTVGEPTAEVQLVVDQLQIAGQNVRSVKVDLNANGPIDALDGDLALNVEDPRADLTVTTRFALANQTLRLEGFVAQGLGTKLDGDVAIDLERLLATGQVDGKMASLAAISPFIGQEIKGNVALAAELSAPDGKQRADLTLKARDVAGSFGRLAQANLQATATDLKANPNLDARLEVSGFGQGDIAVANLDAHVNGTLRKLQTNLSIDGSQAGEPFTLKAKADMAIGGRSNADQTDEPRWPLQGSAIKPRSAAPSDPRRANGSLGGP